MSDRATQTQLTQAGQITASALFTPEERRRWILEITAMTRFEAREHLARLAAEFTARKRAQAA